ncbi:MAG: RbsD or FucU transport [Chitinivibrionales bacterium]|nr:RbsD or FucU transport [Chitinivibrionales bacterium]MBD3396128.1 RbsD or FucU transport [Chitinivibrionales bacterium]
MLKTKLLHPQILHALASAGHGARVLIADGNFPFSTAAPAAAQKVFLNLMPGMVRVTDVLSAVVETVPIESATVMVPPSAEAQDIHEEFARLLPQGTPIEAKKRFDFYDQVGDAATTLVIATGEQRRFANLLVTIGVIKEKTS